MNTRLDNALADASGILFLCSGNIVRSAFAELYARHLACPIDVCSAATEYHNASILGRTRDALLACGVTPGAIDAFRPTHVDSLTRLDARTLVFGMTDEHLRGLGTQAHLRERAFLLPSIVGSADEVADPMFLGGFGRTYALIAGHVEALISRLETRTPA
jgi:protein-tyrosine-phosphatase